MPFVGLGLHVLIALFFAVHAIKSGRQMYWIIILFSFPLLGSLVYFFAEYLPSSTLERGVKKASTKAIQLIDPSKELRESRQAFDLTPTIQNRMRLAAALNNAGEYTEAEKEFDACLQGPFASDPEVCFGAAKAKLHIRSPQQSITLLESLRKQKPEFRPEELSVLLAQCYAANQDDLNAKKEFSFAYQSFGSAEVRTQYALWAANTGDIVTAEGLKAELDKDWARWNKHSRKMHSDLFKELNVALASAKKLTQKS